MEKITVLARLRFTIEFSREMLDWLGNFPDAWFARESGNPFLSEFGGTWRETFDAVVAPEIREYFSGLGVPHEYLPFIQYGETYRGSWIMDAAIVMLGTVGTAYAVLKGVSELPEIADGLTELKGRILKKLKPQVNRKVSERIYDVAKSTDKQRVVPQPPVYPVNSDFVIDARPLRSLTPAAFKSHRIHLSVAVSRDSFTLENLGDEPLCDVQIGLFRSRTERHQWVYQESYMGNFPLVSPRQTIAKNLREFIDRTGSRFDLSDGEEVYVDCWVQNSHGIYLFRFFLEQE